MKCALWIKGLTVFCSYGFYQEFQPAVEETIITKLGPF